MKQNWRNTIKQTVKYLSIVNLFGMGVCQGVTVISTPTAGPITTGGDDLTIATTGQVFLNVPGAVVTADTAHSVTIDPNNQFGNNAILGTVGGTVGISVIAAAPMISIGQNAGITAVDGGIAAVGAFGLMNNEGTISSNLGIVFNTSGNGSFINSATGSVIAPAAAIYMNSAVQSIVNAGLLQSNSATDATLINVSSQQIPGGVINTGTIENLNANGTAVFLQSDTPSTLYQNGGVINGDVVFSNNSSPGFSGTALVLNAGVINGDVSAVASFAGAFYIFDLNDGVLNGSLTLSDQGDIVNLSGSVIQAVIGGSGNDTFNISSGTFTTINGGAGTDALNFLGPQAYTINQNITNIENLLVESTIYLPQLTQATVGVADNFNISVNTYSQQVNGANIGRFGVYIDTTTSYGSVQASTSINLDANTFIQPILVETQYIPLNSVFPILQGSPITDNSTLLPATPLVFFTKQLVNGNTELDLILRRNSLLAFTCNPIAKSIFNVLEDIVKNEGYGVADFQLLISQLDLLPTGSAICDAMVALSPDVSYGMINAAHIGMDRTFGMIWQRVEDIRSFRDPWYGGSYRPSPYGFNGGDESTANTSGFWIAPYGEWLRQKVRSYNDGYKADAQGLAVGYDTTDCDGDVRGAALSFTNVKAVGLSSQSNVQYVRSLQGTYYSLWQPCDAIYTDLMLGLAYNKFQNNRNVNIGSVQFSAYSAFSGWQAGGQFDIGYVDRESTFYMIPVGRLKGTYLRMQPFVEKNAGDLGLSTKEKNLSQLQAGAGIRFVKEIVGYPYSYMPELDLIYLYELSGKAQQTVANFIGGGTSFPTIGVRPPRNIFLIDLAFDAFCVPDKSRVITMRYELELREKYFAHSGYIELYHRWC